MFLNLKFFSVPVLHLTPSHNLTKLKEYNTVCYKQVNQYCHPSNLFIENVVFLKQNTFGFRKPNIWSKYFPLKYYIFIFLWLMHLFETKIIVNAKFK